MDKELGILSSAMQNASHGHGTIAPQGSQGMASAMPAPGTPGPPFRSFVMEEDDPSVSLFADHQGLSIKWLFPSLKHSISPRLFTPPKKEHKNMMLLHGHDLSSSSCKQQAVAKIMPLLVHNWAARNF